LLIFSGSFFCICSDAFVNTSTSYGFWFEIKLHGMVVLAIGVAPLSLEIWPRLIEQVLYPLYHNCNSRGITPKVFSHCLKGDANGGGILVLGEILEPSIVYSPLVPSQYVLFCTDFLIFPQFVDHFSLHIAQYWYKGTCNASLKGIHGIKY
jgi:hypothetical protein